jgi:hypothetical protein
VQFHHAPVAGVLVSALIKRSGSTAWTTVGQARTGADGKVALSIPGQLADFTWKLTVPGNGKLQLTSSATGSIGIASKPVVRATAKLVLNQSTSNNVSGSITFRGAPVAAGLSVQIKTAGSATWTDVTSIKANAQGSFTAVIPAQRANYNWRVVAPTDGFTRLSTSVAGATQVQLGVAAHVVTKTATLGIPSIPTGSKPTFVGASNPRLPAFTVVLRHWVAGVWKVVATSTTNAKGTFTLTGVAQVRGTARYQVLVYPSATQPNVRGYTGVLQVTNS